MDLIIMFLGKMMRNTKIDYEKLFNNGVLWALNFCSEQFQIEAIKQHKGVIIGFIKNPSKKVQLESVKRFGISISSIDDPGHFDYYLNKHCWIEYKDKIIDITATQFGNNFPDVFVIDIKNERYKDRRYNIAALSEVNDWLQQSPRYHKNTINNIIKNLKY